jgi:hypothetical protein
MLDVLIGVITYYIVSIFMTSLITGTSDIDDLIKIIVPLAIAVAVVFVALKGVK